MQPQLRYNSRLCTGCGQCASQCPRQVHSFLDGMHKVDFTACSACGACVDACPSRALKITGYEADPRQIMDVVLKDRRYYGTEGGLTVSGGEPTLQPDFLLELLSLARQEQIHTCLETNGYIPAHVLEALLPLTDLFLLDYISQAAALAKTHSCICKTEIMPYHSLGADKWEELGLTYALAGIADPAPEQKRCWESILHP